MCRSNSGKSAYVDKVTFVVGTTYCAAAASLALRQGLTVAIPRDFSGQRLPRFQNGLVLAYDFDRAKVWSYDRSGKMLMEVQLAVPSATRIHIINIAAALDRTVAVAATAWDQAGRGTPVIFWISPAGAVTRIVHTEPYSASQLAFAPDGSLWAGGRAFSVNAANLPASQFQLSSSYDVLRHYDAQGRLLQTVLPRASFLANTRDPAQEAFLAVGEDRIGFLSVAAMEYVELSYHGQVVNRWNIGSPLPGNRVIGLAVTPSGAVFISTPPKVEPHVPYEGPPVYQLDKASGMLQPVQLSTTGPALPAALLGSDGEKLVFYSKPPAAVSWFTVQ